jgi:hypothetical protein
MSESVPDAQPEENLLSWRELGGVEHDQVWGWFEERFHFRPGMEPPDWPGIREPEPSLTWDISSAYVLDDHLCATALMDLRLRTLRALRQCTRAGEELYAIVRQHACYAVSPRAGPAAAEEVSFWPIPILPDGVYTLFLAADGRFGIFGHPWEMTVCVFGRELLDAFGEDLPGLFRKLVRRDGAQVRWFLFRVAAWAALLRSLGSRRS